MKDITRIIAIFVGITTIISVFGWIVVGRDAAIVVAIYLGVCFTFMTLLAGALFLLSAPPTTSSRRTLPPYH